MKAIFNNPIDGRLRAGWRIFLFLIIFLSLSLLIFPIRPLFGDISKKAFIEDYSIIVIMVLTFSAFIAVAIARRYFDRATFTSLGLTLDTRAILDLCFGFILSAAMAAIVYSLMITLGFIEFKGFNLNSTSGANGLSFDFVQFMSIISIGSIAILLFETILVGIWEELVFRGYLFQNMVAGMGTTIAVIVSCLLYGWIHSMNPNAGILSSSIIILFGFLRLYGYLSTKMLWLSIGMHIGWNFFQGPIFGFAASGHQKASLINQGPIAADWLSGGDFGPEGSVLILPVIVLALLAMRWWAVTTRPVLNR